MKYHDSPWGNGRLGELVRRLLIVCLVMLGLALSLSRPFAAYAQTWRTASAQGWGSTPSAGIANAEANARAALTSQAAAAGEVCTNVTSSSTLIYSTSGVYVYNGTASGYCSPPPPPPSYTVPRSATAQGQGSSSMVAISNGEQAARASILAVGINCTNWSTSSSVVYIAPGGAWYIYNVTVSAMCTN